MLTSLGRWWCGVPDGPGLWRRGAVAPQEARQWGWLLTCGAVLSIWVVAGVTPATWAATLVTAGVLAPPVVERRRNEMAQPLRGHQSNRDVRRVAADFTARVRSGREAYLAGG
eukprot:SAG11_NODE_3958_length_2132_cov_2.261190_3_plen_113_part_00